MSDISIAIPQHLISEIVIRSNGRADIAGLISNIVGDYLDRTLGDAVVWSDSHANEVAESLQRDEEHFGDPTKGYYWHRVFLPNGTMLKAHYKGKESTAEVRHQQIYFDGKPCSPSQFASMAANNTSRNAWRDLWIRRPGDKWHLANSLRDA
ncbi:hypothetical protein [Rhizobium sp. BK377]|uniref:hypothetical protein n=1 Tax=Rhizobium sp. BK377 TaxID=2587058 RepID=UPI001611A647|nr:hypothetical protein [Rhizobium sp. BK377]MBB3460984.1 hypothetical protein [Rhizobium sp. BK377]